MECDSCTDALLTTIEDMSDLLANETKDFKVGGETGTCPVFINKFWVRVNVL